MTAAVSFVDRRDARWWRSDLDAERRWVTILDCVKRLQRSQRFRKDQYLRYARLYGNQPMLGFGVASYSKPASMTGTRLALNVVKNCCDAFTAKLTKDRPKVTFLTSGGDWGLQQKAEQLDKFVEAMFYECGLYDLAPLIVLHGCIFGTGIPKIFRDGTGKNSRIKVEMVFPWELVVDDQEAVYGTPRTTYQTKYYDRVVLEELFRDDPMLVTKIRNAPSPREDLDDFAYDTPADQISITEAWHLKSGAEAEDGRHCIVIDGATLLDEPYDKDYFPFAVYRRQAAPIGYWGIGLAEELTGIQLEMNVLLGKIQRSHHLLASGHWLVEANAKINSNQLDNDIGSIIRYTGTPPQLSVGQAVMPEVYQHLDRLYSRAYELTGISQLSAQSQKPAGLDSGKALSVYANIESERFMVAGRAYQAMFLEIARQMIDLGREIADEYPDFEVKSHGRNSMQRIRFLDVDLRDEERVLKLYPTNQLAQDPAVKMAQVERMANVGWVDASDAKRLLDFPDLESVSSYENASYDLTMEIIDKILSAPEPEYIGPEPFMNLQDSMKRVQLAYLRAKARGADEERLDMLRDWMKQAEHLLKPPPPPAPPPQPGVPTGPPANTNGPPPMPANTNGAPPPAAAGGGPPPGAPIQ